MESEIGPEDVVTLNRLATIARVLAGTAHDVNNALQIIGGSAELLEGQPDLSESQRRSLQRIRSQSARAATAVDEVMQFARDRSDAFVDADLRAIVAKAVSMRAFLIRRAGLTLAYDAASATPAPVRARPAQLLQLVLNLILNAEQALAGQAGGTLSIVLTRDEGFAELRIADNGPGLADGLGERAFTPFVTTRARTEAPGLGLAAARLIAGAHGGTLAFESQARGLGTVLRLPLTA